MAGTRNKVTNVPLLPEPIIIDATKEDMTNLQANSEYFRNKAAFEGIRQPGPTQVSLTTPPGLVQGLCVYLTVLNMALTPSLPNFETTDVEEFIKVCLFYGFDTMMTQMSNFCLDTGIIYSIPFVRTLANIMGNDDKLVTKIQWGMSKMYMAALDREDEDPYMMELEYFTDPSWSQNLLATICESPDYRCNHFLPICPECYKPLIPNGEVRLTPCCREPIHRRCYRPHVNCNICRADPMFARGRLMYVSFRIDDLLDAKCVYWSPCNLHPDCVVNYKDDRITVFHLPEAELLECIKRGPKFLAQLHKQYRILAAQVYLLCHETLPPEDSLSDGVPLA